MISPKCLDQIKLTMAHKSCRMASNAHFFMMVLLSNTALSVCEFFYKIFFDKVLDASKIA